MPLSDLITALERAAGPSRELDERLATEVFGFQYAGHGYLRAPSGMFHYCRDMPRYTLSLDAITGALEQRWLPPDWVWYVESCDNNAVIWNERTQLAEARAWAATPALALCLAAARLAAREAGDE